MLDKTRLPYHDVQMANDVYDDAIAYLDRRLGSLLDELGRRGVLDDTLVIVTSDHGEHLGDHLLFFHGCSLYRQLVEVPLVIVDPNVVPAGRVVAEPVEPARPAGDDRRPARAERGCAVPRPLARPVLGQRRSAAPRRLRAVAHGDGQADLS